MILGDPMALISVGRICSGLLKIPLLSVGVVKFMPIKKIKKIRTTEMIVLIKTRLRKD